MKNALFLLLAAALLNLLSSPALAPASDNKTSEAGKAKDFFSTTKQSIKAHSGKINYSTTAGRLIIKSDSGEQKAHIFFVAYEKKGGDKSKRPLTFAFNGGPGSSSVWLHLGALGPRRVRLHEDGSPLPPPPELVDNEYTWLEFTDIVFIDPVGTGYSRAADEKKEKEFFGFKSDIESVGDFIRLYLTRYDRWLSPKYLAGESYGTTRAVGLIDYIRQKHGIDLSGVILISPVLDFNTIDFSPSNDLPHALFLSTYAAAAWHHNKRAGQGSAPLEDVLAAAESLSLNEYMTALTKGAGLDAGQKESLARQISSLTGISKSYVLDSSLRMPPGRFRKEFFRSRQRVLGRMDARMIMPDADIVNDAAGADPSLDRLEGVFAGAANHYLKTELNFQEDAPYLYLNESVNRAWDWKSGLWGGQGYISVSQALADAIHLNTHLKVFIASGYYDLATPYFAAKYTVNHLELDESLRNNVKIHFYNSGHMMYTDLACLKKLSHDAATFYREK